MLNMYGLLASHSGDCLNTYCLIGVIYNSVLSVNTYIKYKHNKCPLAAFGKKNITIESFMYHAQKTGVSRS